MREYAILVVLASLLVIAGAVYVTNAVAGAMDNVANTIAEGSHHG